MNSLGWENCQVYNSFLSDVYTLAAICGVFFMEVGHVFG